MYCKNCGKPIFEGAVFCSHCGVSLISNTRPEPTVVPPPQPQPSLVNEGKQDTEKQAQGSFWSQSDSPSSSSAGAFTPPPPPPMPPYIPESNVKQENGSEGLAIASLVLGILGVFSSSLGIPSILAIIFGILGRKSKKQGLAKAGLILGIVGLILVALSAVAIILRFFTGNFLANNEFFEQFLNEFAGEGLYF